MKKLLKFLFIAPLTATIPLTVSSCKQEQLDANLSLILEGKTVYDDLRNFDLLTDVKGHVVPSMLDNKPCFKYLISKDNKIQFQNNIAKNIVSSQFKDKSLVWFSTNLEDNTLCYDFKFTNFMQEDDEQISLVLNQVNGRIIFKIDYFVGVSSNNSFKAKQKISMTYEVKVWETHSDGVVKQFKDEFEKQNVTYDNPLTVDFKKLDVKKPELKTLWDSLDNLIHKEVYRKLQVIKEKIAIEVSYGVSSYDKTGVDKNNIIHLNLNINLNEAKEQTEFYVQFI